MIIAYIWSSPQRITDIDIHQVDGFILDQATESNCHWYGRSKSLDSVSIHNLASPIDWIWKKKKFIDFLIHRPRQPPPWSNEESKISTSTLVRPQRPLVCDPEVVSSRMDNVVVSRGRQWLIGARISCCRSRGPNSAHAQWPSVALSSATHVHSKLKALSHLKSAPLNKKINKVPPVILLVAVLHSPIWDSLAKCRVKNSKSSHDCAFL